MCMASYENANFHYIPKANENMKSLTIAINLYLSIKSQVPS